jgi:hypothetical protein
MRKNNKNLKVIGVFLALVISATISMGAINASTIYEQTITDLETQADLDLQQAELDLRTITDLRTEVYWQLQTIIYLETETNVYLSVLANTDEYAQNLLYLNTLQNWSYLMYLAIGNVGGEVTVNYNNEDIVITSMEMQQFSLMCNDLIIDYYPIIQSPNFEVDFIEVNNYIINEFLVSHELFITSMYVLQDRLQIII